MNVACFTIFTFAGSLVWFIALTLVRDYLREVWSTYSQQLSSMFNILSIISIAGIAIGSIIYRYIKQRMATAKERR